MQVWLLERVENNMKYEYNGNLLEEDRINFVAKEIVYSYPFINLSDAKKAAMLEGKISTNKDIDMEFNRLYNIMLVISENKKYVRYVYADTIKLLKNNRNSFSSNINKYYDVVTNIASYLMNERDFPLLSEF